MKQIPTVTGDVDVDALGITLMHEHIFLRSPELQEAYPGFNGWDEDVAVAAARARLAALKASGIDTIVDMTIPGLGRNVDLIVRAVEGTGLQVILATGYYTFHELPLALKFNGPGRLIDDPEDRLLTDLFRRDVTDGIQETGIKAGVLKCCTDEPGVTPDVERCIRAIARVHQETDAPIITHTHAPSRRGLDQQRILREEGVELERVIIGHCNETTDLEYLTSLMDAGSYIGFDRCGLTLLLDLEPQIETLAELCRRGYADKIVVSHDRHCHSDWFHEADIERLLPAWNFAYIESGLAPELLERGVSENDLEQMMSRNPRQFFAAVGSYT